MNLTPEQINAIVDARILSSIDGLNSTLSNTLDVFIAIFTIFGVFAGVGLWQRKKIVDTVLSEVNKELDKDRQSIIHSAETKANTRIKSSIQRYKEESQEEEYYRNMMFTDLSKKLATELHINESNNLKEIFSLHADRMGHITNLTSGKEKETIRALNSLSTDTYDIIKLESFKKYIKILERTSNLAILEALEELMSKLK